jgi:hypothetical protein
VSNPISIFDSIQLMLSPLCFEPADASVVYPQITAKLKELRELKVDEDLLDLIDDSTQVMLGMKPGDSAAAMAHVTTEIERWKKENPMWFGHLA